MIHLEPVTLIARLYPPGGSYEAGDPYVASCTVQVCGDMAYVSGLTGKFTRGHYRQFREELRQLGVEKVFMIRHGVMKHERIGGDHGA